MAHIMSIVATRRATHCHLRRHELLGQSSDTACSCVISKRLKQMISAVQAWEESAIISQSSRAMLLLPWRKTTANLAENGGEPESFIVRADLFLRAPQE